MGTLNDEVKRFVVQALACYDRPAEVAQAVKAEFGIDIPRQQVEGYDPTKHAGRKLSKKWATLFEDTRAKFRDMKADIPIAQRAYRLRALERLASKAETMKNLPLVLQVLEQAAKEVGDAYVNRRLDPVTPAAAPTEPAPEYVLKPDEDAPAKPIL